MSVTAQTPYKKYTAAPAATLFTTDFRLLLASDLVVKVDSAVVTTGFTVSGIGAASADVTFGTPMVGGEIIELQRSVPKTRATDYQQLGDYQASAVNADFDRIVMMLQDANFLSALAVLLPVGDLGAPMTLPALAERALKFLAFDASGNPIASTGASSSVVSAAMAPVVAAATLAAARAAIGLGGTYADLAVAQSFTAAQRGAVSALTDGATITPNFALANHFSVTLGGNRTLANPTNQSAGQSGVIVITQDGTGSRTLAYGSNWKFPSGTAPTLTTTAAAVDVLVYQVESASRITARLVADVK